MPIDAGLRPHRHPGVGDDAIGPGDRLFRVARQGDLPAFPPRPIDDRLRRRQCIGAGEAQREAEAGRGMDPADRDVVAVAAPRHHRIGDRPLLFLQGHDVGHDLARVRGIGEAVDHRHGCVTGEIVELLGVVRTDHDRIDIARQDARRVGNGLAAADLAVRRAENDRIAAELAHRHLERDAGAGRWLLEDHRQRLAF